MDYLPLFHRLQGKPCLVVGGGHVALRKVGTLAAAGARLSVVAPDICEPLRTLAAESQTAITFHQREYRETDLDGVALVVVATNLGVLNTAVSSAAQARQIPVNVVDHPELCSVVFPAIVDRSPVLVAVSTGASSPTLGRLLRSRIESLLPGGLGRLAGFARRFREPVKKALPDIAVRTRFWESILEGDTAEQVYSGNELVAEQQLQQALAQAGVNGNQRGEVYLVGAGPGDPDLLTFKALRLMQRADVVLYDRLVSAPVLDLVRRDAERIYVGKRAGDHAVPQHDINQLLVDLALQGRRVLRLKGGDPFIFGRGGEEIERLAEFGVPFQVVPGITAASGSASYAGIPLTHRDYSQSVHFVTGHQQADGRQPDWAKLAAENQTLVFYMSLANLDSICTRLVDHGLPAITPVALIEKATTPEQRVLVSDLRALPGAVHSNRLRAPTLLIVGEVVQLRDKLAWYRRDAVIVEDSENE